MISDRCEPERQVALFPFNSNDRGVVVIEMPRAVARDWRNVLRRVLLADTGGRAVSPLVRLQARPDGLTLQSVSNEVAVRLDIPGEQHEGELACSANAFATWEGARGTVRLEKRAPANGRASWDEAGAIRNATFPTLDPDTLPAFPKVPAKLTTLGEDFWVAFSEASKTAACDGARYALQRVQLRGRQGDIVGSDGRQLYQHNGFSFPWQDNALLPRLPEIAACPLAKAGAGHIGRTEEYVFLQSGPWTVALKIDQHSRFPDVSKVMPSPASMTTTLHLSAEDSTLLVSVLPKLPTSDQWQSITLDQGKRPMIRAGEPGGPAYQEVLLERSAVEGPALCLMSNRRHLYRALRMGFTSIRSGPDKPLVCRDERRIYLWMPVQGEPSSPANQLRTQAPTAPSISSPTTRRLTVMPSPIPTQNGSTPPQSTNELSLDVALETLLVEAESLRTLFVEATNRLGRLVAGLKHQRRQAKAVASALASLRPFQTNLPVNERKGAPISTRGAHT